MQNLTLLVPYRNERAALSRLLVSLPDGLPVIAIDDASETPPPDGIDGMRVIRLPKRGYFSGAVNAGLAACATDVLVLNQDVWAQGDAWQSELDALRGTYGIIGDGIMRHPAWPRGYVQGTAMFIRRDVINAIGGFNEKDFPLWGATAEYQARTCRKGFMAKPIERLAWFTHEAREPGVRYGKSIAALLEEQPDKKDVFIRTPPLVSIIIPCYNYGHYLKDCINSIRGGETSQGKQPGQTFAAWEAIIVDDCSTDDSYEVALTLADAWQGIRVVKTAHNRGTASAINAGIRASFGKWFTICSADDMLAPTYLETLYRIVEDDPHAMPYTDQLVIRGDKKRVVWQMSEYDFEQLLVRNHVPPGIMTSKVAWQEVGGYPVIFGTGREDWAFAVALGRAGYCGVRVAQPLYWYRRQGQNRTDRNAGPTWRATFVAQMKETFPDLYKGERPMGCCGGGRRPARQMQQAPGRGVQIVAVQPGSAGLTMIEYVGGNIGKGSWWGPVTGIRYEFGGSKRLGYVDDRDLAAMLEYMQGHKLVFKRHVRPVLVKMAEPETVTLEMPQGEPPLTIRVSTLENVVALDAVLGELPTAPAITPAFGDGPIPAPGSLAMQAGIIAQAAMDAVADNADNVARLKRMSTRKAKT